MMMEIYFDEEKCKEHNYNINERYQIIDKMYWRVEGLSPLYREDCMQAYYNSRKHFLEFAKKRNINVEGID